MRWWACRARALRSGRNPAAYLTWLLSHPDAGVSCTDEDAGREAETHNAQRQSGGESSLADLLKAFNSKEQA